MSTQRVCCAGFGGQVVLSMGKLLAYAGMLEGKEVSWCPSYGPEMRGGTANCSIVVSDEPVGSPVITADATASIVMNQPSYDKFVEIVGAGGTIILNSSLIESKVDRTDVKAYYVPANDIAKDLGNPKLANIVLLGALLEVDKTVSEQAVLDAFTKVFGENKAKFIPINKEALAKGAEFVKAQQ